MVAMIRIQRKFPLDRVYGLLEPGPVVLLATAHKGRANVMAMSWHTMMEFVPPLVGCVVSGRNWSFDLLRASKECVIAIPTATIARKVVAVGNVSGRRTDKFAKFGLTALPASRVDLLRLLEDAADAAQDAGWTQGAVRARALVQSITARASAPTSAPTSTQASTG